MTAAAVVLPIFEQPIGIAIAGNEVFVSDAGNNRIQVFDRDGRFLRLFGSEGEGPGELARPSPSLPLFLL